MSLASDKQPARNGGLRRLPSVDRLLQMDGVASVSRQYGRPVALQAAREVLADVRDRAGEGAAVPSWDVLAVSVAQRAEAIALGALRPVINATGVIIHTNLGRAPLSDEAVAAMAAVCSGYSNLEFDLEAGDRGSRHYHLEALLCRLTGAEAGFAVNNNAAAVLLALSSLAAGREVVIARGQLVEIGGGFRVPDVMRQSGATVVEVGTTNRTHLSDYEAAIGPDSALLLRVHPSNFRIVGFTSEVSVGEMVALGARYGLPVVDDLGSGALLDSAAFGLTREPMVQDSIAAGAGLVCFSGDKLVGGPQAGIVVGRRALIDKLKRHPLARALRLDKAGIAGLQATLLHYLRGDAVERVPVWQMVNSRVGELDDRARKLQMRLRDAGHSVQVVETLAAVGGGSLPGETLPSRAIAVESSLAEPELAARLRSGRPAVVGRIERDCVLLDLRTVLHREDDALFDALCAALAR